METIKKLITLLLIVSLLTTKANDTTYVKTIVDTSAVVKQNIILKQKNKDLKARNAVSSSFAGAGFITAITIIAIYTRP